MERMKVFAEHWPGGSSVLNFVYIRQLAVEKPMRFIDFDYGEERNMREYGQPNVPELDPTKIKDAGIPIALITANKDGIVKP